MGRSSLQGTPWHYEEDGKYQVLGFYNKQRQKRREVKKEHLKPKPPIELPISKPGSYVFLETLDGNEVFSAMAHINVLNYLHVGDKTIYEDKEYVVSRIQMPIHMIG